MSLSFNIIIWRKEIEIMEQHGTTFLSVMICENDLDFLHSLKQALVSDYYSVLTIDSGTECLIKYIDEKVKGNQIDLLVVDYELQDLPGDIVASTIRELSGSRARATNTILISSCELDKELIEELKRKDYIVEGLKKPISIDSLMKIIETVTA